LAWDEFWPSQPSNERQRQIFRLQLGKIPAREIATALKDLYARLPGHSFKPTVGDIFGLVKPPIGDTLDRSEVTPALPPPKLAETMKEISARSVLVPVIENRSFSKRTSADEKDAAKQRLRKDIDG